MFSFFCRLRVSVFYFVSLPAHTARRSSSSFCCTNRWWKTLRLCAIFERGHTCWTKIWLFSCSKDIWISVAFRTGIWRDKRGFSSVWRRSSNRDRGILRRARFSISYQSSLCSCQSCHIRILKNQTNSSVSYRTIAILRLLIFFSLN